MISIKTRGSFKNTERFIENSKHISPKFRKIMERYGNECIDALQEATPKDTGNTANSWSYTIEDWGLAFSNSNMQNGVPIAILLQNGHATRNGGYISGQDYINPALDPIFDKIVRDLEREVRKL